jgi:hypothetical protein
MLLPLPFQPEGITQGVQPETQGRREVFLSIPIWEYFIVSESNAEFSQMLQRLKHSANVFTLTSTSTFYQASNFPRGFGSDHWYSL